MVRKICFSVGNYLWFFLVTSFLYLPFFPHKLSQFFYIYWEVGVFVKLHSYDKRFEFILLENEKRYSYKIHRLLLTIICCGSVQFRGDLVTASPDVFQVALGTDAEFLLLASDGLWDYINRSIGPPFDSWLFYFFKQVYSKQFRYIFQLRSSWFCQESTSTTWRCSGIDPSITNVKKHK